MLLESTEPVCALLRRNSRRKRTSGRRNGWSSKKRGGSGRKKGSERGSDATAKGRRSARGSESEKKTATAEPEIERETGSGTGSQTEAKNIAAPNAADPGEHSHEPVCRVPHHTPLISSQK